MLVRNPAGKTILYFGNDNRRWQGLMIILKISVSVLVQACTTRLSDPFCQQAGSVSYFRNLVRGIRITQRRDLALSSDSTLSSTLQGQMLTLIPEVEEDSD